MPWNQLEIEGNLPWLLNQHDLDGQGVNQNQAIHMCYAFAGASVIRKLSQNNAGFTAADFANAANIPLGTGGIPFATTKSHVNNCSLLINNTNAITNNNNDVCAALQFHNRRLALIRCEHQQDADLAHVFILRHFQNQWCLYNVWRRTKYVWEGNGNHMNLFPNAQNNPRWIPTAGQAYWR